MTPGPSDPSPLAGLGGMGDLGGLMAQAQEMQAQLQAAQAEVAGQVVQGQAGGGVVRIEVSGAMEFRSVTIDPSAVDPDDVEMLQDLVLAALHDATHQVNELQAGLTAGFGDLGGLLG
ncbi:MAG TPA: YbaB/EbfC family nucleoid-associated protein [Acidimicrobiales bacterium]|jgi:nucleoid-associated protein EbfC|nr:YbaB/EbfC family nucleoid-associated protein [Acidimicrobiales bacterium]